LTGWSRFTKVVPDAKKLIQDYIDEHKLTFQADSLRDYMDVYLQEIYNTTDIESSFFKDAGGKWEI
jgi:hypothetical protein